MTVLGVVGAALRPSRRWWLLAVPVVAGTIVAIVLARSAERARDVLAAEHTAHCRGAAQSLHGIAEEAIVDRPDSLMTKLARKKVEQPATRWIVADMDLCLGWRRAEGCQQALYAAMKHTEPERFAKALEAIAGSMREGLECLPHE